MHNNILNNRTMGEWKAEYRLYQSEWNIKTDDSGFALAIIEDKYRNKEINKANAAFICKAVNNYNRLLEALKELAYQYEETTKMCCSDNNIRFKETDYTSLMNAKEAIKKAEAL